MSKECLNRTESIRLYCIDCTAGEIGTIKNCSFQKECTLWPMRMGKTPKGVDKTKVIRRYCRECIGANPSTCQTSSCSLWAFRTGKRTAEMAIGDVFSSHKCISDKETTIGMEALVRRLSGTESGRTE